MERIINIHVEKLPEGFYLATCDEVQGLVAQGRTIAEVIEIARDVVRRLFEAQRSISRLLPNWNWQTPSICRYTTIPNHTGDMPEGTLHAVLQQAGISPDEFLQG